MYPIDISWKYLNLSMLIHNSLYLYIYIASVLNSQWLKLCLKMRFFGTAENNRAFHWAMPIIDHILKLPIRSATPLHGVVHAASKTSMGKDHTCTYVFLPFHFWSGETEELAIRECYYFWAKWVRFIKLANLENCKNEQWVMYSMFMITRSTFALCRSDTCLCLLVERRRARGYPTPTRSTGCKFALVYLFAYIHM